MGFIQRGLIITIVILASPAARASWFIPGDVDGDGVRSLIDVVQILGHMFQTDQISLRCLEAADVDNNGTIEITDAVDLLQYLYLGSPPPWPKPLFPGCIYDRAIGTLDCEMSEACSSQGVFFVCDRSGSMSEEAKLQKLQREAIKGILQLSEGDQFAVIFFNSSVDMYPASSQPAVATAQTKSEALAFIMSQESHSYSCPKQALLAALDFATESPAAKKEILYFTDGFATCAGIDEAFYESYILDVVRAKNVDLIPIDAIGIGSSLNEAWLNKLASQNGGSYASIP
jgi:hypothetical protein